MLMAADEIASIVSRGRAAFDDDVVLRRAVERCLEIIGEAAKSVSPELRGAHPDVPWSDMAKIRDRLSHHYHRIDPAQLWTVAEDDAPVAAERLREIKVAD
jgi:uncharacterized protein with HEPN domain